MVRANVSASRVGEWSPALSRREALRMGLVGLGAWASLGKTPARGGEPRPERIYLTTNLRESVSDLYAIDPENGSFTPAMPEVLAWRVRVSPDRRWLAVRRDGGLWLEDLTGEDEPRKVAEVPEDTAGSPPVWSADGREIVYSPGKRNEERDHWDFETWRIQVDGSGRRKLDLPVEDFVSDWSPDGSRLVVVSGRKATLGWTLYLMRPDGTEERRLTEGGNPFGPRFSPDGRQVAYHDGGSDEKRGIWTQNIDGSAARRIFQVERDIDTQVCWSPDGSRLVVATIDFGRMGREGTPDGTLVILDCEGKEHRRFPAPLSQRVELCDWR